MDRKQEILLIYAKADDQPLEGDVKGWVTNFKKFFTKLFNQIDRSEVELKFVESGELKASHFNDVDIVLTVFSESFIADVSATKLLTEWADKLKTNNELVVDGISRLFIILKSPADYGKTSDVLGGLVSYDFYLIDSFTGKAQEFKRFFGAEAAKSYWMKMVDLAYDISQIKYAVGKEKKSTQKKIVDRNKTVYLANTGKDLIIHRDVVKRELKRHGYEVLPKYSLPLGMSDLENIIKDDLKKCRLSVHLIGEDYGDRIEGADISIVDVQNKIAHEHLGQMIETNKNVEKKEEFSRLIWVSPDMKNITERQKIFIEDIKTEGSKYEEAEVLQVQLEELKSIVLEELITGGRLKTTREIEGYEKHDKNDKSKVIYLIADKTDLKSSKAISDHLIKKGYRVLSTVHEGELIDIRYIHQENLRRCDGSIIYFGNTTESWIKTKLQDLLKAPGFGRDKPLKAKAVYLESDKEMDKHHFEKNKALVLGNNGDFKPEHLEPFLTKLDN